MYYNDEIKQKYLATLKLKRPVENLFLASNDYEIEFGIDLGEMPKSSVAQVLKSFGYYVLVSCRNLCSVANMYRKWYHKEILGEALPEEEVILATEIGMDEAMRKSLFLSWNDVQSELIDYDYRNGDPTAPTLALNWLGFKNSDIVSFRDEQIDWRNGLIFDAMHGLLVRDVEPSISRIFEQYKTTETGHRVRNHDEYVEREDSFYFIYRMVSRNSKRDKTKKYDSAYLNLLIQVAASKYETKTGNPSRLSSVNVFTSGCLRRVHEYLRTNPDKTTSAYQVELKRLMCNPNMSKADIEEMHRQWTIAFGLNFGSNDVYP